MPRLPRDRLEAAATEHGNAQAAHNFFKASALLPALPLGMKAGNLNAGILHYPNDSVIMITQAKVNMGQSDYGGAYGDYFGRDEHLRSGPWLCWSGQDKSDANAKVHALLLPPAAAQRRTHYFHRARADQEFVYWGRLSDPHLLSAQTERPWVRFRLSGFDELRRLGFPGGDPGLLPLPNPYSASSSSSRSAAATTATASTHPDATADPAAVKEEDVPPMPDGAVVKQEPVVDATPPARKRRDETQMTRRTMPRRMAAQPRWQAGTRVRVQYNDGSYHGQLDAKQVNGDWKVLFDNGDVEDVPEGSLKQEIAIAAAPAATARRRPTSRSRRPCAAPGS